MSSECRSRTARGPRTRSHKAPSEKAELMSSSKASLGAAELFLRSGRQPDEGGRIAPPRPQPQHRLSQLGVFCPLLHAPRPRGPNRCLPHPARRCRRCPLMRPCVSDGHQNNHALFHFMHTNPTKWVSLLPSSQKQTGQTFTGVTEAREPRPPAPPTGSLTVRCQVGLRAEPSLLGKFTGRSKPAPQPQRSS